MGTSFLVVEDDDLFRSFLVTVLREEGHRVEEARNGKEGLAKSLSGEFDVVITDIRMPGLSGMEVLRQGKKEKPNTRWVVITAFGSIPGAVEAMKAGASDYLSKPLQDPDELRRVIRRIIRELEAESTISLLSEELGRQFPPGEMIFLGERMQAVLRMVKEVAPTPSTVLISGPSGTGKELVARVIHRMSPRKDKPFVAIHCAALSETLLESELFGHERGAFTGAVSARKGRFELADGGTVFLDEVADIPPPVQVKLLRVLQEREFERVGGEKAVSVDVRIISATNKDLKAEVAAGRFREDLFYRLNVFPLFLPPLAERPEAILPLADYFAQKFFRNFGKKGGGITPGAQEALASYPWPGNIRELQNVIERAVILSSGKVDVAQLNLENSAEAPQKGGRLENLEREAIQAALSETGGNRKRTAEVLGISLRTLQYRIKDYGL